VVGNRIAAVVTGAASIQVAGQNAMVADALVDAITVATNSTVSVGLAGMRTVSPVRTGM